MIMINKHVWVVIDNHNIIRHIRTTKHRAVMDVLNKDGWNIEKHEVTL